jgi:esterase
MNLFSRTYEPTGSDKNQTIVILHGLFGSSDNWLTQARLLSQEGYRVYTVDLANHGLSPHTDSFDYQSMVAHVVEFLDVHQLNNVVLIGHSMGGKVSMNLALTYGDRIQKLIVVDMAPRAYNLEHYVIVDGLNAVKIKEITSRQEADAQLAAYVPEADVRQFLLKNLQRTAENGFEWKINLPLITKELSNIGLDLYADGVFDKPALFIRGERSNYVRDEDINHIHELFPLAVIETLPTGHWVQAEKPQEFVHVVSAWIG